ncbi:MAG TPA: ABC transporter permease [Candidatus Hydrogenedentes bacterium]|nr:ABC transporter permease [Candidatus Hydrogenedentota bacterium]HOV74626.1 ABC transporter permease [Candidatus Hydrogenedentota bacterium]HPC15480.1 ABC transporter permease [Candidatus Hydrogenedentota bacterium]HRT20243.1 ABC transporter permease [Candidatus Hydrogenedentota bacterium]HRT64305.1 ABC transporter permease [Candidatus Hydrogenedentota bacterium]
MLAYIVKRLIIAIPTLLLISIISFVIIQLPPGDYLTTYIANLAQTGETADEAVIESLRARYGLDKPLPVQYIKWIGGVLHGDFGQSFSLNKPVRELIWERLALTMAIALITVVCTWIIAVPIGIYSATHQYKFFDYFFTFLGFIGMSTPAFLFALILMWISYTVFGTSVGGLFSDAQAAAPWSWAKVADLLRHIWAPVTVLAVGGTADLIRLVRANLLDQLEMPYVVTARAKGLSEWRLLIKYPVRIAINPIVSTIGWMLPGLISGSVIVDMVLSLPTTGPLMMNALMEQDMYLAGSFILILSTLTVIGTLISDILLAWVDPRIRFGGQAS